MQTILVVDDDLVSRVLVRHIVADLGYGVLEAGDGFEALDVLGRNDVALVLCDQEMPSMTGLELRAELGTGFGVPFVLLTGYAEAGELGSDGEGIDGWLTKPASSVDLAETIHRCLETAPTGSTVRARPD